MLIVPLNGDYITYLDYYKPENRTVGGKLSSLLEWHLQAAAEAVGIAP